VRRATVLNYIGLIASLNFASVVGGQVSVVTPSANLVPAAGDNSPASAEPSMATLLSEGEKIAQPTCLVCHGQNGAGGVGPALRQNVANSEGVVRMLLIGGGQMPPIGEKFTDREIAAVVTYVRNSWGNQFGVVSLSDAAIYRKSASVQ
jgi:mono/diheme cytochrome c family protein